MADTWVARQGAAAHASGKSMLDVFNATGSARILRAYLLYLFNSGTTAVTGVLTGFAIRRITAASAGSAVTPVAFDTSSTALDANTTAGTGRTVTASATFRSFVFCNEEPTTTGAGYNNLLLLVPFAEWGRYGVDNSNLDPIVCRAVQGVDIAQTGTSAVGSADAEIIFTSLAS
jgi:hypothetical protein